MFFLMFSSFVGFLITEMSIILTAIYSAERTQAMTLNIYFLRDAKVFFIDMWIISTNHVCWTIFVSKSQFCQRYLDKFYSWIHLKILNTFIPNTALWLREDCFLLISNVILVNIPCKRNGMNTAFTSKTLLPKLRLWCSLQIHFHARVAIGLLLQKLHRTVGWLVSPYFILFVVYTPLSSPIICCLLFKTHSDRRIINLFINFSRAENQQCVSPGIWDGIAVAVALSW